MPASAGVLVPLGILLATLVTFGAVRGHAFLNWDDAAALVRNDALDRPGAWAWAFTTTHMSHHQPLSWLAWAALRRAFGGSALSHHLLSLFGHALNALLLFLLGRRTYRLAGADARRRRPAAAAAALLFALHPLRVEVVAWASAFPYVLALAFLLLSTLAYLRRLESPAAAWLVGSLVAYAASLLSRPVALGFPLVLLALDLALRRPWRRALLEKVPFALVAVLAGLLEGQARAFVGLDRIGWGPRLSAVAAAPYVYLGRLAWPLRLSPLDALPLDPRISGAALVGGALLLAAAVVAGLRLLPRRPWLVAGAIAYLALLAPALGLAPSGLQATADRYTYLPDVAIALLLGAGFGAAMFQARRPVALAGLILAGMLGTASARQTGYWRDSVTLWTRAAELDPRNDVAFYNLALALEEAGDAAGAEARLRETLRLVPDHEPARRHLASLEARRLEWEAGGMAASGRLEEAIAVFTRALEKDPARMRAHASRGMALAQLGRFAEAAESLEAAVRLGNDEPEVAGALAFVLGETGRLAEARGTLDRALARYPGDARLSALASRLEAKAHVQQKKSPRP